VNRFIVTFVGRQRTARIGSLLGSARGPTWTASGEGRGRDDRAPPVEVGIDALDERVVHCGCRNFIWGDRACPSERCRSQKRRSCEQAGSEANSARLQQSPSIQPDSNGDNVLHHRGYWRDCAVGNGRAAGRKLIFQDIVGTRCGSDPAAWLFNRHCGICAAPFWKFLGKHHGQQRRDCWQCVGQSQTDGLGRGIVASDANGNGDIDGHCNRDLDSYCDCVGNRYCHRNSNGYCNSDCHSNCNANRHRDRHPYNHGDRDRDSNYNANRYRDGDRHAYRDDDSDCNANRYRDVERHSYNHGHRDRDSNCNPNRHRDRDRHLYNHGHRDGDSDRNHNRNSNCNANRHRDGYRHSYNDGNRDRDGDRNRHFNRNGHFNRDSDSDAHCHCNSDGDCNRDSYGHGHGDLDTDCDIHGGHTHSHFNVDACGSDRRAHLPQ
jgi:hypothetical protein